jgi:hypothetical protein
VRFLVLLTEDDRCATWDGATWDGATRDGASETEREQAFAAYRAFAAAVRSRGRIAAGALAARLLPAEYTIEVRPTLEVEV